MFLQKPMLGTQLDHSDSLNNPVLDLLMNEGHGDRVNDLSGCGNHGTLRGFDFPPTRTSGWNPGTDGVALTFDGSNDKIDCGNNPSLNLARTMSIDVSFRTADVGDAIWVVAKGDNYNLNVYGIRKAYDDKLHFRVFDASSAGGDIESDSTLNDNIYHRAIGVVDLDTSAILYVDGILQSDSLSMAGVDAFSSANSLFVGAHPDPTANSQHWDGSIARLRILPRAMSAFEVMQAQIDPYGVYLR